MGKIIGIMSLKGGVGKTSVVASLVAALAGLGKKVLLIDANFSAPNLGIHFNLIEPEKTLHDVMTRRANLKDVIYAVGDLDIIPAAMFNDDQIAPLRLKEKIKPLKKKYDVILIDSSPSVAEEGLATLFAADEIFFVITPDHATLSNTIKTVNRANQRGTAINGLILNKVHSKDFELTLEQIEDTTNVPVMAVLPYELNVLEAQSNFIPSVKHRPKSRGSREFKKLAATLMGEKHDLGFWKKIFRARPKKEEINRELFYDRIFNE